MLRRQRASTCAQEVGTLRDSHHGWCDRSNDGLGSSTLSTGLLISDHHVDRIRYFESECLWQSWAGLIFPFFPLSFLSELVKRCLCIVLVSTLVPLSNISYQSVRPFLLYSIKFPIDWFLLPSPLFFFFLLSIKCWTNCHQPEIQTMASFNAVQVS